MKSIRRGMDADPRAGVVPFLCLACPAVGRTFAMSSRLWWPTACLPGHLRQEGAAELASLRVVALGGYPPALIDGRRTVLDTRSGSPGYARALYPSAPLLWLVRWPDSVISASLSTGVSTLAASSRPLRTRLERGAFVILTLSLSLLLFLSSPQRPVLEPQPSSTSPARSPLAFSLSARLLTPQSPFRRSQSLTRTHTQQNEH